MPRRKKTAEVNNQQNNDTEFIYCGNRKCPHTECLRHNVNTPYDVLILRRNFDVDKKEYHCKFIVTNMEEKRGV